MAGNCKKPGYAEGCETAYRDRCMAGDGEGCKLLDQAMADRDDCNPAYGERCDEAEAPAAAPAQAATAPKAKSFWAMAVAAPMRALVARAAGPRR